ncbi:hypothetical protein J2S97_004716 [Arthrobacter oryzae]|nr:hypothetical protein [Arthrobacter oryzae]
MSTPQPFADRLIGQVLPTERTNLFATSIRARSAPAREPRRSTRPSRMEAVLLRPLPPLVRHHWHRTETQAQSVGLSLALSFPMTLHVRPTGNEWRPIDVGRSARSGRERATPRPAPPVLSLVQQVVHFRAAPPLPHGAPPQSTAARRGAQPDAETGGSAPSLVPMVQRRPQSAAPDPAPGSASPSMPSQAAGSNALRAYWGDSSPTAEHYSSGALTSRDLPVVVDHVVREIDRRFIAARERRGWVG